MFEALYDMSLLSDVIKIYNDADGFVKCSHSPQLQKDLYNLCTLAKSIKASKKELINLINAYLLTKTKNEYCEMFTYGTHVYFFFSYERKRFAASVKTLWDLSEKFTFAEFETDDVGVFYKLR